MSRRPPEGIPLPEVAELPGLSLEQLRALWPRVMGKRHAPSQRSLLLREVAWRIQEEHSGGLDPQTQRLLAAAVRAVSKPLTRDAALKPARVTRRRVASLPSASRLVREWRGVKHEVLVLEDGKRFSFRGREYRSLSRIAREITGVHWSGPRFFGLTTRKRKGGSP